MADNIINARFKQRYDTEANWKSKNPILLAGEMAISSDSSSNLNNFNYKVGDGVSAWTQLPYSYSEGIVLASSGNKNKNEWIRKENTHEAIIDKDTFYKTKNLIKERTKQTKTGMIHIFSGKVFLI